MLQPGASSMSTTFKASHERHLRQALSHFLSYKINGPVSNVLEGNKKRKVGT